MSFEALFQAETLRMQEEDERRRAARRSALRSAGAGAAAAPARRSRHLPALHLPHRHRRVSDGVRLAG